MAVIILNKADLLDEISLEALKRQVSLDKGIETVAISAIQPQTLKPLVEKAGEILAEDSTRQIKDSRLKFQTVNYFEH